MMEVQQAVQLFYKLLLGKPFLVQLGQIIGA